MFTLITILVIALIVGGISLYFLVFKKRNSTIGAAEMAVEGMFKKKETAPQLARSKFFPDDLFVGQMLNLDTTLKYLLNDTLFAFPSSFFSVKGFTYFEVDGNKFEEIELSRVDNKDYLLLYSEAEEKFFMLNRVASLAVTDNNPPDMATQDTIRFEEEGKQFFYTDVTGLMELSRTDASGIRINHRLLRVYERELTAEDQEFLIGIIDNRDVVNYYVGVMISIHQLM